MPALEFNGVTKEYRRRWWRRDAVRALDDFSLTVQRGEIFGFLGPNGAGKSTAIHIALGLMRSSRGRGQMLGEPFGHAPTRRRVGFLAENVAFYHRPAAKLVRFYGALNRVPQPRLAAVTRELLEQVDLEDVADRNVAKFSRGMLQRVGLAQALVNDPELVILDEPTSALDPAARVTVRQLLVELRAQGKTVFLSSHLLSEVEAVCDRVAFLRRGRVVRLGGMAELLVSKDHYEIVARRVPPGVFPGATSQNGVVRVEVAAPSQRAAIEQVWASGGEVISVNPLRQSLEQVFLELTGGEERAAVANNEKSGRTEELR